MSCNAFKLPLCAVNSAGLLSRIPALAGAQHEMKKTIVIWFVLAWAIVSGCFVTDLFVCPWTAVFHQENSQVSSIHYQTNSKSQAPSIK
jgi:hypothetical protein